MIRQVVVLGLVLLATVANGHFAIFSPAVRAGSNDLTEPVAPCGGLPLGARSQFPVAGGSITGALYHPTAEANFSLVVSNSDPTNAQFAVTWFGPGENAAFTEGGFSVPIDLTAVQGCVVGANATLQVVMITVDGTLHECMDVTLIQSNLSSTSTTATKSDAPSSLLASLSLLSVAL
ncbi:hypothetical protein HK100_000480, partial [Physocladia obscura]